MATTGTADNCDKWFIVRAFHLYCKPIIQLRMGLPLVQSPQQVPAGSAQVILIVHADHVLCQMPRSTVQQRMQRDTLIHVVLAILQCALLAVLADLHEAIPGQKVHPPLPCMHVAFGTSFKFGAGSRIFNHLFYPPILD